MGSKLNWEAILKVGIAVLYSLLVMAWIFAPSAELVSRMPHWAVVLVTVVNVVALIPVWIGLVRQRIWLMWMGLALAWTTLCIAALTASLHRPTDAHTLMYKSRTIIFAFFALMAWVQALVRQKLTSEARKADSSLRSE